MTQAEPEPEPEPEPLPSLYNANDRRITCETLADDHHITENTVLDYAPDSFWLSKDAEFDWFDRNAFLDRKQSIKGNSNPNVNPIVNPSPSNTTAGSLQISSFLKSKAAQKKTGYVDSKRRNCKLANILLFPKRSDSIGKEPVVLSMTEPSSPKVSCLGRVRSKSCNRRRKVNKPEQPVTRYEKTRFINRLRSLFGSGCRKSDKSLQNVEREATSKRKVKGQQVVQLNVLESLPVVNGQLEYSAPRRKNVTGNLFNGEHEATVDSPALGDVTRLSSGRQRENWLSC